MSDNDKNLPFTSRPLTRRSFLKLFSLLAILPAGCSLDPLFSKKVKVNDVHSRINRTQLEALLSPTSEADLRKTIDRANREDKTISISGSRHAMGGQQFGSETVNFDTRDMNKVLNLDHGNGIVEVEAGIQWPKLINDLNRLQQDRATQWTINQKQTGADRLTIGGAVSANAHGRRLTHKPMIRDVESFTILDSKGRKKRCSRSKNSELFRLAVGGYGLFGPIYSVNLRLVKRHKVQRRVVVEDRDGIIARFDDRIAQGYEYGDFQFSVDDKSDHFLKEGVFSCYKPVSDDTPVPENRKELSDREWMNLVLMAHENESKLFKNHANYYRSTDGQVYWSDNHQLSTYVRDYHNLLESYSDSLPNGSEMITELYVPREKLNSFMKECADFLRRKNAEVIYGTVRLIKEDDESFLPWARGDFACVIFNLHIGHSKNELKKARERFRGLIDIALGYDGSFFLTYHRWATKNQIERAYPKFRDFLQLKKKYDPRERFQSDWYRHYKKKFM